MSGYSGQPSASTSSSRFSLNSFTGGGSAAAAAASPPPRAGPGSAASASYGVGLGGHPAAAGASSQSAGSSLASVLPKVNPASRIVSGTTSLQQQLFGGGAASSGPGAGGGIGGPPSVLDRPLNRAKGSEISLGAFAFLFSEIVAYSQSRVDSVTDLERRLSTLGYDAGLRILNLILLRNAQAAGGKDPKREHRLIPILQFVHTQVYKYCFGKAADGLERSVEAEDEYMLTLNQPPLTQHISIPKDLAQLSCEAFTAGIVEGVLDGLDVPARVTAHTVATDQFPQRTVILIKLDPKVMDREEALGK